MPRIVQKNPSLLRPRLAVWQHTPQPPPESLARRGPNARVAGVDEAGRGPWAGPVVAAAVMLHRPIRTVRIDDSKQLTPRQRRRAFDVIATHAHIGMGVVCAETIDRDNILQATLSAMRQAVLDLPHAPHLVLVDGPYAPPISVPCQTLIHGDQQSKVIACASIVAKVVRDDLMAFYHELYPAYGFNRHWGYGTALHAQRLAQCGPSLLHRRSFKPLARWLLQDATDVV